jgi:hypothetical protein
MNDNFEADIVRILKLADIRAYGHLIDSYYLFEDTELAKGRIRSPGLGQEFGLAYLKFKFYGFMNACYLQQQAAKVCVETLKIEADITDLMNSRVMQYRNDFAAHSPNRGRGAGAHSFILDKFGLIEGRISGYSSNSPAGFISRDIKLIDLLAEWESVFVPLLTLVSGTIVRRVEAASIRET